MDTWGNQEMFKEIVSKEFEFMKKEVRSSSKEQLQEKDVREDRA